MFERCTVLMSNVFCSNVLEVQFFKVKGFKIRPSKVKHYREHCFKVEGHRFKYLKDKRF